MARRFSREHVSQNHLVRPFSTALVQVSGGWSYGAVAPQKWQVTGTAPAYAARSRIPGSRSVAAGDPDSGPSGKGVTRSQASGECEARLLRRPLGTA